MWWFFVNVLTTKLKKITAMPFRDVRAALVVADDDVILDDEEFVMLYNMYQPRNELRLQTSTINSIWANLMMRRLGQFSTSIKELNLHFNL